MKGFELSRLSYNVKKQGYQTRYFRYKSLFHTPQQNADLLKRFLNDIDEPVVHLVCHSLGGIVTLLMLEQHAEVKPGKVIMLGTPVNGSATAKYINHHWYLRWLLGKSTDKGLLDKAPIPKYKNDIYMIAGNKGIGIGKFLAYKVMKSPNDGTVNLSETVAPFIKQHTAVSHGHFAMLWSKQVISRVVEILASN